MICAALDIGSNSLRMLLARRTGQALTETRYFRQVTRLAGDYQPLKGLAAQSCARTLEGLEQFALILAQHQVTRIRAVGTAILRRAPNSAAFIEQVAERTGIVIEVIDGAVEAALSCTGILSVLDPQPKRALLFDVGGGSTEIIFCEDGINLQQKSLELGVVRLIEDFPDQSRRQVSIESMLATITSEPL